MDIINGLTSAAKVLREADKIEQYQMILDAQETILGYQRKISELEEENKKLKDVSSFKEKSDFKNNCYWLKKEDNTTDGPFCSKCVESDDRIIRLHVRSDGFATCPNCKNHVWSKGEVNQFINSGSSFFDSSI
ncbi:MAG TPA: hypothetical protein PKZ36_00310 [Candidatus Paceibacterota bacterium]|nr:hypothetical protein [Candidatus Paceibacterota bacterium]HPT17845.1 hypothetical protein [Candidatus Paceibacterota bacterium]